MKALETAISLALHPTTELWSRRLRLRILLAHPQLSFRVRQHPRLENARMMRLSFILPLLILGSVNAAAAQSAPAGTGASVVGTWELLTFEARDSLGRTAYPLGKRPKGILVYGRDRRVLVQLFDPDRPHFASGDRARGTDEEVRAAFDGSFAYYGHYSVDSLRGTVTHRVEGASFPNWIGTELVREYHLDRDRSQRERLTITTIPQVVGARRIVTVLVWLRAF